MTPLLFTLLQALEQELRPLGIAVVVEARHLQFVDNINAGGSLGTGPAPHPSFASAMTSGLFSDDSLGHFEDLLVLLGLDEPAGRPQVLPSSSTALCACSRCCPSAASLPLLQAESGKPLYPELLSIASSLKHRSGRRRSRAKKVRGPRPWLHAVDIALWRISKLFAYLCGMRDAVQHRTATQQAALPVTCSKHDVLIDCHTSCAGTLNKNSLSNA